MRRALAWLGAAGLLFALSPRLHADPPPPSAASAPPERRHADERVERRLEQLRRHASGMPSALPPAAADSATLAVPALSGSAASGRATLDELARRWAERAATRDERRERHRAELLNEAGSRLADPQVKAELRLHATRLADLARVEFLAKNARSGAVRDKLLARVVRLAEREASRHHRRMAQLMAAAPSGRTAPPPASPTTGAAR